MELAQNTSQCTIVIAPSKEVQSLQFVLTITNKVKIDSIILKAKCLLVPKCTKLRWMDLCYFHVNRD